MDVPKEKLGLSGQKTVDILEVKCDLVYLYVAAPVSAIRYKCQAAKVDIPYQYDDGKVHMDHVMKLTCLEQYEPSLFTLDKLKEHGVYAVRGPRNMPDSLLHEIEEIQHE